METLDERTYEIVRTLPDGQIVSVGSFADVNEARKCVAAFAEFWPGDYVIIPPQYESSDSGSRFGTGAARPD